MDDKFIYKNRNLTECEGKVYECNGQTINDKFEPKTREELELEFKELIYRLDQTRKHIPFLNYRRENFDYQMSELKELFYNVLKRIN